MNLLGIVLLFVGGHGMLKTIKDRNRAEQSKAWRTADGTIVKSVVETKGADEFESKVPRIEYSYQAEGKTFMGNTIGYARTITDSDAYVYVKKYPAGASVRVRYNPDNVQESSLETGSDQVTSLRLAGSVAALAVGIYLLLGGTFGK